MHPLKRFIKTATDAIDKFLLGGSEVTPQTPHIRDYMNLKRYMISVIMAVAPTVLASIYFFGWRALLIVIISYLFGVTTEWIFATVRREELNEGAFVTCLIYPMILPPRTPLWIVAVGIVFGTIFGKEVFGGTGKNIFNPALVGRLFIAIAFPSFMSGQWYQPVGGNLGGFTAYSVDSITTATPLANFKNAGTIEPYLNLFIGDISGCLGETCKLLILLGGIFLIITKVSNWRIPIAYLGTVALLSYILSFIFPDRFAPPIFQLLAGGLMFGAMFMATDPVSGPMTLQGKWICGILLGVLTVIIRGLSGYVEGVMFSIILMNIFAPLIDTSVLSIIASRNRRRV